MKGILPVNAFARGVSVIVGGTAGAQLLMVLVAPILTRIYTPAYFNVRNIVLANGGGLI
jgi:hypothetical protein